MLPVPTRVFTLNTLKATFLKKITTRALWGAPAAAGDKLQPQSPPQIAAMAPAAARGRPVTAPGDGCDRGAPAEPGFRAGGTPPLHTGLREAPRTPTAAGARLGARRRLLPSPP